MFFLKKDGVQKGVLVELPAMPRKQCLFLLPWVSRLQFFIYHLF